MEARVFTVALHYNAAMTKTATRGWTVGIMGIVAAVAWAGCADSARPGATGLGDGGVDAAVCSAGAVRCNDAFMRETCGGNGAWAATGFVCARNVAVDDETGGYCVTKGDGTFRCAGEGATEELPVDRYLRVQVSASGLVGLTEAGRLVATRTQLLDLYGTGAEAW